jgi:hypothetical protein
MSDELQKHGVKLASNQVEFSLLRSRALTSGLLDEMNKRDIRLLACKCPGRPSGETACPCWTSSDCGRASISYLAMLTTDSPLGMGRLTGKYSSANPPPSGRR